MKLANRDLPVQAFVGASMVQVFVATYNTPLRLNLHFPQQIVKPLNLIGDSITQ